MYTTFVLDELGNKKIIMDWRGTPPFQWNEVKIEDLLSSHPNHCAGLEFAHFWTGDDWHLQHNHRASPDYGYLPNFKGPDLPSPRSRLERNGTYTRSSSEKDAPSYLPVQINVEPSEPNRGTPRIRCGLCAWNLGMDERFALQLPPPESQPPQPPNHNRFASILHTLIAEEKTSREKMANAFSHKGRWRDLDRWLNNIQSKDERLYLPQKYQLKKLCSAIIDPPIHELEAAISADRENFKRKKQWQQWQLMFSYPEWATLEFKNDGTWYHHHHCGRSTHDRAEVTTVQMLQIPYQDRHIDILMEHWKQETASWKSYALTIEQVNTIPATALQSIMEQLIKEPFHWKHTAKFHFASTQEK